MSEEGWPIVYLDEEKIYLYHSSMKVYYKILFLELEFFYYQILFKYCIMM